MSKKIKYLVACLAIISLFASCENEIAYHGKEFSKKLILNAFIDSDSLSSRLHLSFTGKSQLTPADETVVTVSVNGEVKEKLRPVFDRSPLPYVDITTRFSPGDVVRIDARTDDSKHHAWIEETVPYPVEILQIDTGKPHWVYPYSYKHLRFKIRFQDPPNQKNYYRVVIEQQETLRGKDYKGNETYIQNKVYSFWPWEDLALTDGRPVTNPEELDNELFERVTNYYGVFDDSWFKDSEYTLNTQVIFFNNYYSFTDFTPETLDADITVKLLAISETEFYYLNTLNMLDSEILEEYLNDPIKIPGNVHGGTGFVGINAGYGETIPVIRGKKIEYYDY